MNTAIFLSTLLLTFLSLVGLFFFIRASVKDRTQEVRLVSEQAEASLMTQLQQYFAERSYRVVKVDAQANQVVFAGVVRPSLFLTVFLTLLAAIGILCLALVLSVLLPQLSAFSLWLVLLSPAAGIFYWKKAERSEVVSLKLAQSETQVHCQIIVTAHRDELAQLQQALKLKTCE